MAKQRWLNNFDTELIGVVKALPDTGTPATELGYGIIQVPAATASVLPALSGGDWFLLTLFTVVDGQEENLEIVKVTSIDTSSGSETRLTVLRGQEGTTVRAYAIGDKASMRMTAASVTNLLQKSDNLAGLDDPDTARSNLNAEPAISAGTTDQYWRGDKDWRDFSTDVRGTTLTGLSTATNAAVTEDDSVLVAHGKLQAQMNAKFNKTGGDISGNVNVPSLNDGQLAGFRNKIINGKMGISQRNGGTVMALTDTPTYFNDRWSCVSSSAPSGGLFTGRTTITGALGLWPLGDGFEHCLYFQRGSGAYAGFARAIQVLETGESLSLAGRTVTLSFWAAVNTGWLGGNITASILTGTGTDQTAAQFFAGTATGQATANSTTVTPTTTLTKFSVQATIPLGAKQVAVLIQNTGWSGSGSSPDIVAITGVQLEVGPVATPFEHRHYGLELALCRRYFERFDSSNYAYAIGGCYSAGAVWASVALEEKRSAPILTCSGPVENFQMQLAGGTGSCTSYPYISIAGNRRAFIVFPSTSAGITNNGQAALMLLSGAAAMNFSSEL